MSKRILIVDDSDYVADAVARLIEICGYETKAVYDGQQALDAVESFAPDMALLNIGMPGLDGYETATRIRRSRLGDCLVLVAVTCWAREEDRQRAFEAGFDLHVPKPICIGTLHHLLGLLHYGLPPRRPEAARLAS